MKKKILSILLAVVMVVGMIPLGMVTASAADTVNYVDLVWNESFQTFEPVPAQADAVRLIDQTELSGGWYYVYDEVNIGTRIIVNGDAQNPTRIILSEGSMLRATMGIEVAAGKVLYIYEQDGWMEGTLEATVPIQTAQELEESYAPITNRVAGIGGSDKYGGDDREANCGTIVINGGIVKASGGNGAAGIGGGCGGSGGTVIINRGVVEAVSGTVPGTEEETMVGAAGIGAGDRTDGGNGGTVIINGGMVTATGGRMSAGIGGSYNSSGGSVTINDGTVIATGGDHAAGIGGGGGEGSGGEGSGGSVTINGGKVTATGGYTGAGIGGGSRGTGGEVTINGGEVTANGGDAGAGIGGGEWGSGGSVTVNYGTVNATGGDNAAGIGGGNHGAGSDFTINGGKVIAIGGVSGVGIGSGDDGGYHGGFNLADNAMIRKGDGNTGEFDTDAVGYMSNRSRYVSVEIHVHIDKDGDGVCDDWDCNKGITHYLDRRWDEANQKVVEAIKFIADSDMKKLDPEDWTLSSLQGGWYYVDNDPDTSYDDMRIKEYTFENRITVNGDAETPTRILLKDGAKLNAEQGIEVNGTNALYIYGQINGTGTLEAKGSENCAGIGGNNYGNGGKVTILGGTVNATGGQNGAGIGGGQNGMGGEVTILGGMVNAAGGQLGAGIGGSNNGNGGKFTIRGGTVVATGGAAGAGIGGGEWGSGGEVTITGGTVVAAGGSSSAAGIGGGSNTTDHGMIDISESENAVVKQGKHGANHLQEYGFDREKRYAVVRFHEHTDEKNGDGFCDICNLPLITYLNREWDEENSVLVETPEFIAAAEAAKLTPENVEENALYEGWYYVDNDQEYTFPSRIQITAWDEPVRIILKDGAKLNAQQGINIDEWCFVPLYIYGQENDSGTLEAKGSNFAAGIGGDSNGAGGTVTVNGGTVNATGNNGGAGIGGGFNGLGGTVTINGGKVTATGTTGAGIGGGNNCSGGKVTVNGGTVNAIGGNTAAGIGAGNNGSGAAGVTGGEVTVNGGTVTATGGQFGAGIGGGYSGDGSKVTINGGTVTATGGSYDGDLPGIGAGYGKTSHGDFTVAANSVVKIGEAYDTATTAEAYASSRERYVHIEFHTHSLTKVETKEPTCTEPGIREPYWVCECGKYFSDEAGTTEIEEEDLENYKTEVRGHDFDSEVYVIGEGEHEGQHGQKCTRVGCDEIGNWTYHVFTDGECVCGAEDPSVSKFTGTSLALKGDIEVNLHVRVVEADQVGAKVSLKLGNGEVIEKPLGNTKDANENYIVSLNTNAIQMADTIEAKLLSASDKVLATYEDSVVAYNGRVQENSQNENEKALVNALVNYGHYAQLALSPIRHWVIGTDYAETEQTGNLISAAEELAAFAPIVTGSSETVTGLNISLLLDHKTSLCIYLTTANGEAPAVTVDGVAVQPTPTDVMHQWLVQIDDIDALNLSKIHRVTADGYTFYLSALTYGAVTVGENNINAMRALLDYYKAALTYAGKNAITSATAEQVTYTGVAIVPTLTVEAGETTLTEDDYTVEWDGELKNAGTYYGVVTGKGSYAGSAVVTLTIAKATPTPVGTIKATYNPTNQQYTYTGSMNVAGRFTPPQTAPTKNDSYKFTFTPNDPNYAAVELNVSVTVSGTAETGTY